MGEIVNLRSVRKARRRAGAEAAAGANRLRFGRTRAEREGEALEAGRAARLLDGARLDGAEADVTEARGTGGDHAEREGTGPGGEADQ